MHYKYFNRNKTYKMGQQERIKKAINWLVFKGVVEGQNALAELLGYSKSYMSQALNGHENLSSRFVQRVCALDENLNYDWVLSGNGSMFINNPFGLTESAAPPSSGGVVVDASVWEVIKNQAASLSSRDQQINELISMLREEIAENKKMAAQAGGVVKCADAV